MSSLLENMKRTTHAQLYGYRQWDLNAILAPRAGNCTYHYLPQSMERPVMNNEQFREYFSTVIPLLQGFDCNIVREIYDESARTSVIHGFSTATSTIGPYKMEFVLVMDFDEAGERVVEINEMMDSAYMANFLAKLTAHLQAEA